MQAKSWKTKPSKLLGVKDKYVAFCLDQAIHYFGSTIESELGEVEGKSKAEVERQQQQILDSYLYPDGDKPVQTGQFADPALMFGTKGSR